MSYIVPKAPIKIKKGRGSRTYRCGTPNLTYWQIHLVAILGTIVVKGWQQMGHSALHNAKNAAKNAAEKQRKR